MFLVGPNIEVVVPDPIANSSKLVFPNNIAPELNNLFTTVAVYVGLKSCSILEPQVVGMPFTQKLSLIAIGIPSKGDRNFPTICC